MQAGGCYIVFDLLNSQENEYINRFIIKKNFRNSVYSLYGYFNLDLVYTESELSLLKNMVTRESKIYAYFIVNGYRKRFYKGVCTAVNLFISDNKKYIQIQTSHSTYRLKHENVQPMESCEDISIRGAIQGALQDSNSYERIIFNSNALQSLDTDLYSGGQSQSIYQYMEAILKQIPARMFTTILNDKTTLYIYDTGSFLDSISTLQTLKENQVLEIDVSCDYTGLIDEATAYSENGMDSDLDADYSTDASNLLQHSSIGVKKFLKTSTLDLGKINRIENTLATNDSESLKPYTDALIADAIDSSFYIRIEVPSLLKDITNPLLGVWELGGRINVDNELIKEVVKLFDLDVYLNSTRYFFVIKNIEYNETADSMTCNIDITMNDVLRFL